MDKVRVSIAIPASIISDTPHLREKTSKIGLIARAAAIFRVEEIIIYLDNTKVDQTREQKFIALLLRYLETPQYLRKTLFKLEPDLQYAGILPPLRIPHHPLSGKIKHLKIGEYREGVVLAEHKDGLEVDIGVQHPALMRHSQFKVGTRLTTQIVSISKTIEVQTVNREEVPQYWGYHVQADKQTFGQLSMAHNFDLRLATAKIGTSIEDNITEISRQWNGNILVGFGAPSRGLHEIAQDQGLNLSTLTDFILNTIPNQGTATVRTEEALLATLAILNIYFPA
ncbi:MAG: RNA methyltransferase [Nitrososphaerota archaeon]|jgi:predicted SPOUT superfamily RNA methylase MTH1|nr:RNA methyltransferase [Nitrososphaerota archaeon]